MRTQFIRLFAAVSVCFARLTSAEAQPPSTQAQSPSTQLPAPPLHELQQQFVDLRFGMFIHFNIPTYMDQDWADPDAPPDLFNPTKLDCNQWARAAKAAHMSYGC